MKAIREGEIAVLPRNHTIVDVFVGKGWENRTLIGYKQGAIHTIKGEPLTEEQANAVIAAMGAR